MALSAQIHYQTQQQTDVPNHDEWLGVQELDVLRALRFEKRRRDWRLGRWTAKLALTRFLPDIQSSMSDWEIIAESSGAPSVNLAGNTSKIQLSLSHSNDQSLVTLSRHPLHTGCDMERIEKRGRSFEETFFTAAELDILEHWPTRHRDCLVTLIWSAKESVLKSLRTGLKVDTRRVEIHDPGVLPNEAWQPLMASDELTKLTYHGWWRNHKGMIHTVVADLKFAAPIELR